MLSSVHTAAVLCSLLYGRLLPITLAIGSLLVWELNVERDSPFDAVVLILVCGYHLFWHLLKRRRFWRFRDGFLKDIDQLIDLFS